MMKLVVAIVVLGVVVADKLDNTYLPPNSARTAGGNGNFLSTPNRGNGGVAPKYGPPSTNGVDSEGRYQETRSNGQDSRISGGNGNFLSTQARGNGGVAPKYGAPSGNGVDSGRYSEDTGRYNDQGARSNGAGGFVPSPDAGAGILRFNNENFGDGTYRFEYETENKIFQEESGELKNQGTDSESSSVQGSYSYMGTDGIMYTVNYIADENGFQPIGEHLPTAPPVPEAIQRALDLLATQGGSDDESEVVSSAGYPRQGSNGNGYQSNNGNGYQSSNGNGYQNNNGYQTNNGYQSNNGNGYQSSNGNGYQNNNSNGYQTSNGNGYQKSNGYQSSNGNGYQTSNGNQSKNGYQSSNGNGFQPSTKSQQGGNDRQSQIASRQYLAPNKPSFNSQSGYQY